MRISFVRYFGMTRWLDCNFEYCLQWSQSHTHWSVIQIHFLCVGSARCSAKLIWKLNGHRLSFRIMEFFRRKIFKIFFSFSLVTMKLHAIESAKNSCYFSIKFIDIQLIYAWNRVNFPEPIGNICIWQRHLFINSGKSMDEMWLRQPFEYSNSRF